MKYELVKESMTPCGGSEHAIREILEVEAESPMAYVEANKRFPIMDVIEKDNGDITIITGNEVGYMDKYNFTE